MVGYVGVVGLVGIGEVKIILIIICLEIGFVVNVFLAVLSYIGSVDFICVIG